MRLSNKKGFTIIELLVSLAIVAILLSIAFTSLSGIRQKSRDAKRMSGVREIKKRFLYTRIKIINFRQA